MKKYIKLYNPYAVMIVVVFSSLLFVSPASAASSLCQFDRDLDSGVADGEDILCLQKFLNKNGFIISSSGVGSPGKETNQYKNLTKEAVIKWQKKNNLSPAIGNFGPKSRAKYEELMSGTTVKNLVATSTITTLSNGAVDVSPETLALRIAELKSQLSASVVSTVNAPTTPAATLSDTQKHLRLVAQSLQSVETKVDASTDAVDYKRALSSLTDARADFLSAVIYYLDGNNAQVETLLTNVELNTNYALKYIKASDTTVVNTSPLTSSAADANKKLAAVTLNYTNARGKLTLAVDAGLNTTESSDLLKQARTLMTKSKTYIVDESYKNSLAYSADADELINKAVKLLTTKTISLSDYYTSTRNNYKTVLADMKKAVANGDDVGDSKQMLSDANSYLSDASDYIDSHEDSSARRLLDKAVAKINSAKNEY